MNQPNDPPLPKSRPNPMAVASYWLGARLIEKPSGYWLDGVPVNLPKIMQETNRALVQAGVDQLGPDGWRV
jgi:hypothetical protein